MLETFERDAAWNMGLDEALLEDCSAPPTLRFYTWSPAALSLGYFQRFSDVPAAGTCDVVVRRITGGGAIHHADELTFSLVCAATEPLYRGPIGPSYERVHALVAAALARFGVEAELRGEASLASDRELGGMCFHESTPLDLAWGGRKGVGSAQRRKGSRVLHHGSIKLGVTEHEEGVAADRVAAPELARALAEVFASSSELELEPGTVTAVEAAEAEQRGRRYTSPEFVRRR